jgi:hypothetical protein
LNQFDGNYIINAAGGNITITLPVANSLPAWHVFTFRRVDQTTNTVTIQGNGGQIINDGLTSVTMKPRSTLALATNGGTIWYIDRTGFTPNKDYITPGSAGFDAVSPTTTLGDLIYRGSSSNLRLAGNTVAARKFLAQLGDGVNSAAPTWNFLTAQDIQPSHLRTDVPSGAFDLAVTNSFQRTLDGTNGTLTLANEPATGSFSLVLKQDGTGGRATPTFWTGTDFGGATYTITPTANKRDLLLFEKTNTNEFQAFILRQNF